MGADHPIAMVLLIFICLFGIAITTKGTSFTIETNYRGSPVSAVFGSPANRTIAKTALIGD